MQGLDQTAFDSFYWLRQGLANFELQSSQSLPPK
jgi:hypothetical protein